MNTVTTKPRLGVADASGILNPKELASKAQLAELLKLHDAFNANLVECQKHTTTTAGKELAQARLAYAAEPSNENAERITRASDTVARTTEHLRLHHELCVARRKLTCDKIVPAVLPILCRSQTIIAREITALDQRQADDAAKWGVPHAESDTLQSARALLVHVEKRIQHLTSPDSTGAKCADHDASPKTLLAGILSIESITAAAE